MWLKRIKPLNKEVIERLERGENVLQIRKDYPNLHVVRNRIKEVYSVVSYERSLNVPLMREDFGLDKDVEVEGIMVIDDEPVYMFKSLKSIRRYYSDVEVSSFIDEEGDFDPNRILETIYDPGRATISEVERTDTGFEIEFILENYEGIPLSEEKEKRYMYRKPIYKNFAFTENILLFARKEPDIFADHTDSSIVIRVDDYEKLEKDFCNHYGHDPLDDFDNIYPYDEEMKEFLSNYADNLPEPEDGLYIYPHR